VGHEITNPLSYIIGSLETLEGLITRMRNRAGEPDQPERALDRPALGRTVTEMASLVRDCQKGTERIHQVLKTLHSLARRPNAEHTAVDVHKVLASSIAMAWNHVRHRARLVQRQGALPPLLADESRLEQLFLNLLINAAQAIPEGNAEAHEIRISTRHEATHIVVEIADTGAGIPPHVRARLFEPFFTTKPVGVGTGLGLSICQSVADEHGAKLEVESEVGHGSVFRVRLPCRGRAVPTAQAEPAAAAAAPALRPARLRVLVVEDEELVALTIKRMLDRHHEALVVSRGSEALALLGAGQEFDVIVCDLMMPNMTGMQLFAEIERRHGEVLDRMLFMTGGAFSTDADEFLQRLPRPPLIKPFQPKELLEAIERVGHSARAGGIPSRS
jgi:CheY-like chemotaxis protein